MADETPQSRPGLFGLLLRGALFLLFIRYGGGLIGWLLSGTSLLVAAAMSLFIAATLASLFVVRTFERGRLEDIGMAWGASSVRHFWLGVAAGIAAALVTLVVPLGLRMAALVPSADPANAFTPGKLLLVSVVLLFGAVGEEMMFRGYAFQILLRAYGPWWVIPPFGVLFALAHLDNMGTNPLGIINTGLWGIVFGYAFYRAGDLWLPIGLHFGWNWTLPLFGVNLSGFTMGLTGHTLNWTAGTLWSGGAYGTEGSLLATVSVLLLGAWLWRAPLDRQAAPLVDPPLEPEPGPARPNGKES